MAGDDDASKLAESIHHNAEVRTGQIKFNSQYPLELKHTGPAKASVPLFGSLER